MITKALTPILLLLTASSLHAQPSPSLTPAAPYPSLPTMPPPSAFMPVAPGIGVLTQSSEQGYTVLIDSTSLPPESIRVDIDAHGLLIHSSGQRQYSQRHSSAPGQQQFQSYSYSSSSRSFRRRLPIPMDADPSGAVRADNGHRITIFIPRLAR